MANRLGKGQRQDFSSKLIRMGFIQIGDCTFFGETIKIFRTNKTHQNCVRYWQIQDIVDGSMLFRSNHVLEILEYLSRLKIMPAGSCINVTIKPRTD